jgi:hypothetical protein
MEVCECVWGYNERVRERERDALNFTSLTRKKAGARIYTLHTQEPRAHFCTCCCRGRQQLTVNVSWRPHCSARHAREKTHESERTENKALTAVDARIN